METEYGKISMAINTLVSGSMEKLKGLVYIPQAMDKSIKASSQIFLSKVKENKLLQMVTNTREISCKENLQDRVCINFIVHRLSTKAIFKRD